MQIELNEKCKISLIQIFEQVLLGVSMMQGQTLPEHIQSFLVIVQKFQNSKSKKVYNVCFELLSKFLSQSTW